MMISIKCHSYFKVLPANKREVLTALPREHEHAVCVRPDVALTENFFSIVYCKFFISVFCLFVLTFLWTLVSFHIKRGKKKKKRKKSYDIVPMHVQLIKDFVCKNLKKSQMCTWTIIIHALMSKRERTNLKQQLLKLFWRKYSIVEFHSQVIKYQFWVNVSGPTPKTWRTPPLTRHSVKLHHVDLTSVDLCFRSTFKGFLPAFSSRREKCLCI